MEEENQHLTHVYCNRTKTECLCDYIFFFKLRLNCKYNKLSSHNMDHRSILLNWNPNSTQSQSCGLMHSIHRFKLLMLLKTSFFCHIYQTERTDENEFSLWRRKQMESYLWNNKNIKACLCLQWPAWLKIYKETILWVDHSLSSR